jgi:hypothetical protein
MEVSIEKLRDNLRTLESEELERIATGTADEYRREAIECAKSELLARGVDLDRHPDAPSPGIRRETEAEDSGTAVSGGRPMVRFPSWWFWSCLTAGVVMVLTMQRNPQLREGNSSIYILTTAVDLIVMADIDRLVDWRNQGRSFRIRQGALAFLALGMSFWSLACLLGIVGH